jgi:hypothetical protein
VSVTIPDPPSAVVVSMDVEPNKDGSLTGVAEAGTWFARTVPRGTAFVTHRIATERPGLVTRLASSHEVGVHVHPREFGHEHDRLARLSADRQRELIDETRSVLADAIGCDPAVIDTFRAGRHSASETTLEILDESDFVLDASVHVRYDEHLPSSVTEETEPFTLAGTDLIELPTTHGRLPLASRCGLRGVIEGPIPTTAATLRADRWGCPGLRATAHVLNGVETASLYMHPYDATDYHDDTVENVGEPFRRRLVALVDALRVESTQFICASDVTWGRRAGRQ